MVQFGIHGDPKLNAVWSEANITDDPVTQSNKRGFVTFANELAELAHDAALHQLRGQRRPRQEGFAPFGQVVSGMEVVDKINAEHGETPDQGQIQSQGNAYLAKAFPRLDYIKKARSRSRRPPPRARQKHAAEAVARSVRSPGRR